MPGRIAAHCSAGGQEPPVTPGEVARSILVSLACKYRLVLERLEHVTRSRIQRVHVVGGGARNELLCRLTADLCELPLLAGPDEATALGNVLVQARAAGELGGTLAELREIAAASSPTVTYEPSGEGQAAESYARFLAVTGLDAQTTRPTAVGS
jgi:rhamnulokinase